MGHIKVKNMTGQRIRFHCHIIEPGLQVDVPVQYDHRLGHVKQQSFILKREKKHDKLPKKDVSSP